MSEVEKFVWGKAYAEKAIRYGGNLIFEIYHHIDDTGHILVYFDSAEPGEVTEKLVKRTYTIYLQCEDPGVEVYWWKKYRENNQEIIQGRIIPMFGKVPSEEPFEFKIDREEFVDRCKQFYKGTEAIKKQKYEEYQRQLAEARVEMWKRLSLTQEVKSKQTIQGCLLPGHEAVVVCHQDDLEQVSTIFDQRLETKPFPLLPVVCASFKMDAPDMKTCSIAESNAFSTKKKRITKFLGIEWGWPILDEWKEFHLPRQKVLDFAKE